MFDLVIRNTSEVLTCDGAGRPEDVLRPIPKGAIGIKNGKIAYLGPEKDLPAEGDDTLDARGSFVGPGLVDPHTHLIFGGERAGEFEQRCQGKTYLEIAAAGGGIKRTVEATRAASEKELAYGALPRLVSLLSQGVTTAEVKSGYGLEVNAELKMLRAIRSLDGVQPVKLIPTVLPLHTRQDGWLEEVIDDLLPRVAEAKLAMFCDVFVEKSAFTADEARKVLKVASGLGLTPRLHVDQLTPGGGAELAAELGAATADHLEQVSPQGIAALAKAGTVAVLAPTSTLFLREKKYAPGRALADAGVTVALCTNCNPGSSMTENAALVMALACLECGLTPAEAYLGFTRNAARALRLPDAGRLFLQGPADVVVYQCPSYRTLPYHLGVSEVRHVLKDGLLCWELGRVVRRSPAAEPANR
jgi:imidazolonepropionase